MSHPLPLTEPEPYGFLHVGVTTRAQAAPLYRDTAERRRTSARLIDLAERWEEQPGILSVRVFRTHLIPPLRGAPRFDHSLLIRTPRVDDLDELRASDDLRALGGVELLAGSNAARIGETESSHDADFLFNHFTVSGDADAAEVWRGLTDWYTSTLHVDNSTALRSSDARSPFALVNYARLPSRPPVFLLGQLLRPSFHRMVRGALRREGMRALPVFSRMIR